MKHIWYRLIACALMVLLLAGCKAPSSDGKESSQPTTTPETAQTSQSPAPEGKLLKGIINRIGNYLVLLTDDGVYQTMDFGEGVTMDSFTEGDSVEVTYTGTLNSPEADPVIIAITKVG